MPENPLLLSFRKLPFRSLVLPTTVRRQLVLLPTAKETHQNHLRERDSLRQSETSRRSIHTFTVDEESCQERD
jgi:hypothetical protein